MTFVLMITLVFNQCALEKKLMFFKKNVKYTYIYNVEFLNISYIYVYFLSELRLLRLAMDVLNYRQVFLLEKYLNTFMIC